MSGPMATSSEGGRLPLKKRRAAIACTSCHGRKVRCNVVLVGQPCSNCQQDQALCALHVSARGKHKRRRVNREKTADDPAAAVSPVLSGSTVVAAAAGTAQPPFAAATDPRGGCNESILSLQSDISSQDDYESQANVEAYRKIVDGSDTTGARVPMYVGELQSLRFIFHVAREDKGISCKAHYLVPEPKRRHLSPEELACLEAKGAFSTETDDLRSELLHLFFDYVYPILPIIDPYDFYRRYDAGGAANISPLLLQSMFLAASNFISQDALKKSGWSSVMTMKRRFYERAKALYDFEYETDKLCLIQSVLLLGYWLGNSHDKMDSWHWVGVAISLSQSLGLHRDAGCSRIPPSQRSLWRRIWWCCFYRDRCIALGMGRAYRINTQDCDVKDLTLEDLTCSGAGGSSYLQDTSAAVVRRCNGFAPIFLEILKASRLLGDVLAAVYRPRREEDYPGPSSWSTVQSIEEKLAAWQLGLDSRCRVDAPAFNVDEPRAMILHKYYIQILHHVTIITLYKPFVFQGDILPTNPASDIRARIAWEACQLVTMLIAIVAILFLSKCLSSGLKWHLARQNLDLAMLVVQQLQEKYLAARFIYAYYAAAFDKVAPAQRPSLEGGASILCPTASAAGAMAASTSTMDDQPTTVTATATTGGGTPYDRGEPFSSGHEDGLNAWGECFQSGMAADFDILFGEEGIFRGLDEFDIGDLMP